MYVIEFPPACRRSSYSSSYHTSQVSRSAEPDSALLEARHFRFPNLGSGGKGGEKSHHSGHRREVSDEDDAGPFQARRFRFPKNGGEDDAGEKSAGHSHGSGHRRGIDNEDDAGPFQARHLRSKTGGGDKGSEKSHHSGHHRRELDDDSATADLD